MHSNIYQASEVPLDPENDTLTEDEILEQLGSTTADYVREKDWQTEEDREEDFEWAFWFPAFVLMKDGDGNVSVRLNDKGEYFKAKYAEFKQAAERIAKATFEEFCEEKYGSDSLDFAMYRLNSRYEDKCAFWLVGIDYYGGYPVPLDEWVRHASNGDVLHLGRVFDYHFRARPGKPLRGAPPPISG